MPRVITKKDLILHSFLILGDTGNNWLCVVWSEICEISTDSNFNYVSGFIKLMRYLWSDCSFFWHLWKSNSSFILVNLQQTLLKFYQYRVRFKTSQQIFDRILQLGGLRLTSAVIITTGHEMRALGDMRKAHYQLCFTTVYSLNTACISWQINKSNPISWPWMGDHWRTGLARLHLDKIFSPHTLLLTFPLLKFDIPI